RKRHATEYVSLPGAGVTFCAFDVTRRPFDDLRVRRAFAFALDRETLVAVHGSQTLLPATGGFVPQGMPGHAPGIALPYDPGHARALLAEAGYAGGAGFPAVEMIVYPPGVGVWEAMVAQWNDNLGVEVNWQGLDWTEYSDRLYNDPSPIYSGGWVGDYPDPDNYLRVGLQLHSAWREEQYFEAVERARRTLAQRQRLALYAQAQHILVQEVPILPITYHCTAFLIKPWVKRYPVSTLASRFWKDAVLEPH
ncbi:MAG TPA: ABC transporter substrate-binding protein, partial [Methanomicrobiales archaeon]|nr:ABC transporter substrate-binding protein [Methanomicrobiales archaeon]